MSTARTKAMVGGKRERLRGRDQRGSGTLLVAAVVLVAMVIAAAGLLIGVYAVAQRDAANAADLAALSGAAQYEAGQYANGQYANGQYTNGRDANDQQPNSASACGAARRIATENGAELTRCKVSGDSLDFVVSVTVTQRLRALFLPASVNASAEAGRLEPV